DAPYNHCRSAVGGTSVRGLQVTQSPNLLPPGRPLIVGNVRPSRPTGGLLRPALVTLAETHVKRNRKGKRRRDSIQVWTYPQAQSALPYLSSVVRSLRDHTLEALSQQRTAQIGRASCRERVKI